MRAEEQVKFFFDRCGEQVESENEALEDKLHLITNREIFVAILNSIKIIFANYIFEIR
jgi:hypothetical protein